MSINKNIPNVHLTVRYLSFIFAISLILFSCKKEESSPIIVPMGYEYFPVNIGHSIIYDFDSVFIDTKVSVNETLHFQVKEIIESSFSDNINRPSQRIERYKRDTDTSAWSIKNIWSSTITKTTAEKTEENQKYIKLTFPVKINETWDGNGFTSLPKWEYEYTSVDEPTKIGGTTFDSTLTVTQINELNLIEKKYSVEVYAKHIGLIYKQLMHIEKTPAGVITKANVVTYKIKSYSR